jgi:hypothetical protein
MTEMDFQTHICQGGFLEELAIPLADAMKGVSMVLSSAAFGAKQGVTKATVASVNTIVSTDSARPGRWRSLPLHEQLDVVAEHGKPLPEIIILTLQHRIRVVGNMKGYCLPEMSAASVDACFCQCQSLLDRHHDACSLMPASMMVLKVI